MSLAGRLSSSVGAALPRADGRAVEWQVADGPVPYEAAVAAMEARAEAIAGGAAPELVWLLEHPPLYTAGTSAFSDGAGGGRGALPFPVHETGRGGQMTYHGPGQRVAYVLLDLRARGQDVRAFVLALERWIVAVLAAFDIAGGSREDRVGVWVARPDNPPGRDGTPAEDKIAAIGIRVRRWVTFHGVSLNVAPDLSHFAAIVPCGISAGHFGVTSLADLGCRRSMAEVDAALAAAFAPVFGRIEMSTARL